MTTTASLLLSAEVLLIGCSALQAHNYATSLYGEVWYRVTQGKPLDPPACSTDRPASPTVDPEAVEFVGRQIAEQLATDDPARIAWDAAVAAGHHLKVA
jgi:hypothetical protein